MSESDGARRIRPTTVLIVADVRLYREGLASSLANREHLLVVATSASRADARFRVRELGPDVVLVDMATRDSLDFIRDIRPKEPRTKILAFAVQEVPSDILDCAEAGAAGYVTADASSTTWSALSSESPARSWSARRRLPPSSSDGSPNGHGRDAGGRVTEPRAHQPRAAGPRLHPAGPLEQRDRAETNIAEPTVKNHVHHVLEKLDVTTRARRPPPAPCCPPAAAVRSAPTAFPTTRDRLVPTAPTARHVSRMHRMN